MFNFFFPDELKKTKKICYFSRGGKHKYAEHMDLEIVPCHLCWYSRKFVPSDRPAPSVCGERRYVAT